MTAIPLTGLVGSHPLGALAAFGLLRCCPDLDGFSEARLGWRRGADWLAVLDTGSTAGPDELVQALADRQKQRPGASELNWTDNIKTKRESYLKAATEAREPLSRGDRTYADFLVAFGSELQTDDDGTLTPTAFYMTSGQQLFLKEARNTCLSLAQGAKVRRRRKTCEEMFREAVFGPWRYEDAQHSLGLDPSTERLYALRAERPNKANNGVTAAVWLAFETLPLFPCFHSGGQLVTTGFHTRNGPGRRRVQDLTWPIWTTPVSLDTLRSLLSLPALDQAELPRHELRALGVEAVFRSERYKVKTKGAYYILRPSVPCL